MEAAMATWILVADQSRARIFRAEAKDGALEELADIIHPEGRMHGKDLTQDRPSSVQESVGGSRHGIEPETTLEEKISQEFAHELAGLLEHGRINHDYDALVIMAAPHFLGLLRNSIGHEVSKLIVETVNKNLSRSTPAEIHEYLNQED